MIIIKKIILFLTIIILCVPNYSSAKIITDNTGLITFNTSNQWYLTSFGTDAATDELISIAYDKNTGIKVTKSKYQTKYKNLRSVSDSEKSMLRDSLIKYYLDMFRAKGYTCIDSDAEYTKDNIQLFYIIKKNGQVGRIATISYIKNYIVYSVTAFCDDKTCNETAKVLDTLKFDGIDFDEWAIK